MSTLELEHLKHTSSSSNNLSVHSDGTLTLGNLTGLNVNGNIGIGTTTGSESLTTTGNLRFQTTNTVRIEYLNTTGAYALGTTGGAAIGFNRPAAGDDEIFFETHNGGVSHAERMRINKDGHVTTPNQPICTLQPDTSSNVTTANSTDHIVGWKTVGGRQTLLRSGLTLSAASGTTIANGGSTGRITFSTGGVYYFDCTIRMENTPGAGNLKLYHNGNTIHRMHVEAWGRYNYAHAWISRCVTASANDYVEFVVAVPSGTFSGSNDTVNWLTIIKVA